ncbi:MAG: methyl-accepting chemotaxis protein [Bradyrhizobium sp.]
MTGWLANLTIARKLFIAPSVAVVLLSLMAPLAIYSLGQQAKMLAQLTTTEIEKASTMAALGRAIPEASSLVNRTIALASNSDDRAAVERLALSLEKRLNDAASLIDRLLSVDLVDAEKEIVLDLAKSLKAYADTSGRAARMISVDTATAYLMSANGNKFYDALLRQLDSLRDLERERSAAMYETSKAQAEMARFGMVLLFMVAATLSVLLTVVLSRMISGSITRLTDATLKLADGDLTVRVEGSDRGDEIGALAGAIDIFKSNAIDKRRIEEEQGFRQQEASARQRAIAEYIVAFESQISLALEELGSASVQMSGTSDGMSGTVERTNEQVAAVAAASTDASDNVRTVAVASEELNVSISVIGRRVRDAAGIASRAVEEARQTDVTVQGLAEVVSRIRDVVTLISDIAGQTNLLALNATIEAARAGEAGRGFAVVANEVKSLATQTAKATGDISAQIEAVQTVTRETVEAMRRIGGTISEVSSVATLISAAVEEQGTATREIARSTQQAAARTQEVSNHITGVSEGAKTTDLAAQGVKSAAEALSRQTEHLRSQVDQFLARISAA